LLEGVKSKFSLNWLLPTGSGTAPVALRTGIGVNERWYGVESSTGNRIFVRFRGDLTEKRVKLTQNTASVPVSFMENGFYATYTLILPIRFPEMSLFGEDKSGCYVYS
jgi:hypothetical protein